MSWKASIAAIQAESRQDAVYNSTTSRVDDVDVGRNKKINDRNNIRYEAKEASFDQMQEEQDQSLVKPPSRRKKAAIIPAYGPDEVDNVRTEGAEGIALLEDKATAISSIFQKNTFNGDKFINSHFTDLDEKGIEQASESLQQLNEFCSQELQSLVYEHHLAFLQATHEIALLDQAVSEIRVCMNSSDELSEVLTRKISSDTDALAGSSDSFSEINPEVTLPQRQSDEELTVEELIADLEVASCARDLASATTILKAGMKMLEIIDRDKAILRHSGLNVVHLRSRLESALEESRLTMVAKLEADLNDTAVSTAEIRFSASYLAFLSGDCRAAGGLLGCYSKKLTSRRSLQRKASDAEDSLRLAGGLAQDSFILISAAFHDIAAVFGQSMQEVYALMTQWAMHEARLVARHVRQQILGRLNSAQDMADVARIISLVLVACLTIEYEHGLCLDAKVIPEIWGALESVTLKQMSRMAVERKIQAQEDCYRLLDNPATSSRANSLSHEVWPSASQLLDDVSVIAECLQPLSALAPSDTWSRLLGPGIFAGLSALARGCKSGLQKAIASRDLRIRPTRATVRTVMDLVNQTASQIKTIVSPLELSCGCDFLSVPDVVDMVSRLEMILLVSDEVSNVLVPPPAPPPVQEPREKDALRQPDVSVSEKLMKPELKHETLSASVSSARVRSFRSPPISEEPLVMKHVPVKELSVPAPQSRAQAALERAKAARATKKGESATSSTPSPPTASTPSPPIVLPSPPPQPPPNTLSPLPVKATERNEPKQANTNAVSLDGEKNQDSPNHAVRPPQESRAKAALERAMAARKKLQQPKEPNESPPLPLPLPLTDVFRDDDSEEEEEEKEKEIVPQSRAQAALARAAELARARKGERATLPQPQSVKSSRTATVNEDDDLL